jgi:phenylacetate-coenzyme A ligase PaaK-like adenylate-forming protein
MNLSQLLRPHLRHQWSRAAVRRQAVPLSTTELVARQLRALQQTWVDATSDVPYYRRLVQSGRAPQRIESWPDVQRIPILTRHILQVQAAEFIRDSGQPQSFMKTAGSTGEPLRIGMNQAERDLMRIVKLAEWQSFGYTQSSRLFLIWGHGHLLGTGWRGQINHARRKLTDALLGYQRVDAYRLDRHACAEYAEALIRFKPIGLISYASALDLFARYTVAYRDRFRALQLRFVLSTAEAPPRRDTLARLEDLFGCPVVQEYGGAEFGQVAFKRGDAPFAVYPDLNYVESTAPEAGDPGVEPVLVTTLYPRYLPLIRYRVGDALSGARRLSNGHVQDFDTMAGRINDVIELATGDFIHSVAVFHCVHQEAGIHGIQMVLSDSGIEILLVADDQDRAAMEERIRRRLNQVHPLLTAATFRYVEDLEPTRAGKRRWYVDRRTTPCVASRVS